VNKKIVINFKGCKVFHLYSFSAREEAAIWHEIQKFAGTFVTGKSVRQIFFLRLLIKNPARILFSHFPPAKMDLLSALAKMNVTRPELNIKQRMTLSNATGNDSWRKVRVTWKIHLSKGENAREIPFMIECAHRNSHDALCLTMPAINGFY
jgi:hypothetical protein